MSKRSKKQNEGENHIFEHEEIELVKRETNFLSGFFDSVDQS